MNLIRECGTVYFIVVKYIVWYRYRGTVFVKIS